MSINEIFTTNNNNEAISTNSRALQGTAALTSLSNAIATHIIQKMDADIETYRPLIAASTTDSKQLDDLLDSFRPWYDLADDPQCTLEDDDPLCNLDEATVEGMLKSQQSKRSRLKGKLMTLSNYKNLMSAAIAESILRELYNKPKSAHAGSRRMNSLNYSAEELEALAADQEQLRKEIRNIQSKKSIAKSKLDFDEHSEHWLALLEAERTLKALRLSGSAERIVEVDVTKDRLTEMLNGVDVSSLKAADSKDLLSAIQAMIGGEEV